MIDMMKLTDTNFKLNNHKLENTNIMSIEMEDIKNKWNFWS